MNKVVDINNATPSITVTRGDLLQSQASLNNFAHIQMPVERDNYWLSKTLGKVLRALKHEMMVAQEESNRLIEQHGTPQKDKDGKDTGKKGIAQDDVATMKIYAHAMETFSAQGVVIEGARRVSLSSLQKAHVSLSLGDLAVLHWLIDENA